MVQNGEFRRKASVQESKNLDGSENREPTIVLEEQLHRTTFSL